ncbi:hypothetical protein FPQ18DRAFT_322633 [Pyronema domesticum]|uniref:Uncharacterized protein n=1 Tax=Pyronema omphalodes (strain CBS 100304) TaxID=1076935 RepID=U4LPQ6_PYROM|nr:hypothetical protein FPQ18DRAFT_322633 [Pyronema domesticum]CCX33930.1 Protein of unknown function [Pyronema omphalodes CBS 100304]
MLRRIREMSKHLCPGCNAHQAFNGELADLLDKVIDHRFPTLKGNKNVYGCHCTGGRNMLCKSRLTCPCRYGGFPCSDQCGPSDTTAPHNCSSRGLNAKSTTESSAESIPTEEAEASTIPVATATTSLPNGETKESSTPEESAKATLVKVSTPQLKKPETLQPVAISSSNEGNSSGGLTSAELAEAIQRIRSSIEQITDLKQQELQRKADELKKKEEAEKAEKMRKQFIEQRKEKEQKAKELRKEQELRNVEELKKAEEVRKLAIQNREMRRNKEPANPEEKAKTKSRNKGKQKEQPTPNTEEPPRAVSTVQVRLSPAEVQAQKALAFVNAKKSRSQGAKNPTKPPPEEPKEPNPAKAHEPLQPPVEPKKKQPRQKPSPQAIVEDANKPEELKSRIETISKKTKNLPKPSTAEKHKQKKDNAATPVTPAMPEMPANIKPISNDALRLQIPAHQSAILSGPTSPASSSAPSAQQKPLQPRGKKVKKPKPLPVEQPGNIQRPPQPNTAKPRKEKAPKPTAKPTVKPQPSTTKEQDEVIPGAVIERTKKLRKPKPPKPLEASPATGDKPAGKAKKGKAKNTDDSDDEGAGGGVRLDLS